MTAFQTKAMQRKDRYNVWFVMMCFVCIVAGCASRGAGPQGGPTDSIPPRVLFSVPADGSTHVQKQEIQIRFDEYVKVEKASEEVLVSPPGKSQPTVKAVGKRVSVTLNDSLLPNTTYTIYFGDAIRDNNESNPLRDYTLSFSTGDAIDSLSLSGTVLFAQTLKPAIGAIVGIHPAEEEDSVVYKKPFLRVARTDSTGRFDIRHIAAGAYRVYALSDSNRTYTYEPNEPIAFTDEPVTVPYSGLELRLFNCLLPKDTMRELPADSLRKDSLSQDSIQPDSVKVIPSKPDSTATASLRVIVSPPAADAFVQLLTEKDEAVATKPVRETGDVLFERLKGNTYMLRLSLDLNGDSIWTTGDYIQKRQPEPMYYFPKRLKIRDNWDFEETFRWQDENARPK